MPLSSVTAEISTIGVVTLWSPREGKKSVPPERIVPRDSARAWTASSSVLGRKYNSVILRAAGDWKPCAASHLFVYRRRLFVKHHGNSNYDGSLRAKGL